MRSPDRLVELFRARGLKVTPQREAVFRVLDGNVDHPTADAVHAVVTATMPTVSLRTVYQVLNDLALMGEIQSLDVGTGAARFDPNVDRHHHAVCSSCGKVRDVPAEPGPAPPTFDGFHIDRAEVVYRGRCRACVAGADSPSVLPDHHHRPPRSNPCPT